MPAVFLQRGRFGTWMRPFETFVGPQKKASLFLLDLESVHIYILYIYISCVDLFWEIFPQRIEVHVSFPECV